MGTVISLTVPAGALGTAAVPASAPAGTASSTPQLPPSNGCCRRLDETFSLYRPDSEASRLARGELSLRDSSAGMRDRYADALGWRLMTEGAFSPERPDGVLDLSGIIKGYAIGQAGDGAAEPGDHRLVPECRRRRAGDGLARARQRSLVGGRGG